VGQHVPLRALCGDGWGCKVTKPSGEQAPVLLKFGSFYLASEGKKSEDLTERDVEQLAEQTHKVLLRGARSSPLVSRIIEEGLPKPCWWSDVREGDKQGVASGILGDVIFEANWPARNWSAGSSSRRPESIILALNGLTFAAFAKVPDVPFDDPSELGFQARKCLKAIYEGTELFLHTVGPIVMSPAIYLRQQTSGSTMTVLSDTEVMIQADLSDAAITAMVNQAVWSIVEHYRAMETRSELIHKDVEIDSFLQEAFSSYGLLSLERRPTLPSFRKRAELRTQLKRDIGSIYESHADAMKLFSSLKRYAKTSKQDFESVSFLSPFSAYTAHEIDDMLDWDDSHALQSVHFLEEEARAKSLEQVTLSAALVGAVAGALVGGLLTMLV